MKDLIFKQPAKALFITADFLNDVTASESTCGRGDLILQQGADERRRLNQRFRFNAESHRHVTLCVFGIARPTKPVLGRAIDHRGLRVGVENSDLLFELVRQPDVVGIEEGNELTARMAYTEVARGAHTE